MEVVYGLLQAINERPTILTIGVFDGIHLGHQHLIASAVRRAQAIGAQSAVLTFDPHPDAVLHPERPRLALASVAERIERIEGLGVDLLIVMPFDEQVRGLSAHEYMRRICEAVALRELHIGWDFALGRKREGDLARLRELGQSFGYTVHPVDPLLVAGTPVSSSRVRQALEAGEVAEAARLLGRPFSIRGAVVQGDQRGRTIGFPTANIAHEEHHALPANGVYVCSTHVRGEQYGAVTNIGVRPTFNGIRRTVEAYLLDFTGDLYGETLELAFHERLRSEQKFNGIQELIAQIGRDTASARAWLQAHPHEREA